MSVLIERINRAADKSQPPADVYNVNISTQRTTVTIKWNDPNDTIIGGESLATWKGTILVRKYNSPPTSINDGTQIVNNTVRNRYASSGITDNNLQEGRKIYYRFFTYSTKNKYNSSSNMIYSTSVTNLNPVFGDNSWDDIISAAESNSIPSTWKVGDTKDLILEGGGGFNETLTMQIWGFDHFDQAYSSSKAKLCLGMKNLMQSLYSMNSSDIGNYSWNDTEMKRTVMNNILASMPSNIKSHIKTVYTYANQGYGAQSGLQSTDNVFIPGYTEVGFGGNNYDGNQSRLAIFTDDASRMKRMRHGYGEQGAWWTRSPYTHNTTDYVIVRMNGGMNTFNGSTETGLCVCFNL